MSELVTNTLSTDASLQAYWRLEGNSNDSKDAKNGTDTAISYSTANGKYGEGAGFTSASFSKIIFGDTLDAGTSEWSVGCWVKTTAINCAVISKNNFDVVGYDIALGAAGEPVFGGDSGGSATSSVAVNNGVWHFVVGTREASAGNKILKIYVDGVLKGTGATVAGEDLQNAQNLVIGGRQISAGSAYQDFYDGAIDDAFIFSRKLTAPEILQIYNESAFIPFV